MTFGVQRFVAAFLAFGLTEKESGDKSPHSKDLT